MNCGLLQWSSTSWLPYRELQFLRMWRAIQAASEEHVHDCYHQHIRQIRPIFPQVPEEPFYYDKWYFQSFEANLIFIVYGVGQKWDELVSGTFWTQGKGNCVKIFQGIESVLNVWNKICLKSINGCKFLVLTVVYTVPSLRSSSIKTATGYIASSSCILKDITSILVHVQCCSMMSKEPSSTMWQ